MSPAAAPMDVLDLITPLEGKLKACLSLSPTPHSTDAWQLQVRLFYDGAPAGTTTFTLHGHTRDEAEAITRGIRHNSFMMQEIDQMLWGEMD